MPSPDVVTYLGLELTELDEQTLIDTALANVVETFPDWVPREGNTEVVVLEQMAAMGADVAYIINQLPGTITEVVLRIMGATRDQGSPPSATATFTLSDDLGHTVPAGTVVRLDLGDNVDPVDFTTTADLTIAPGNTTGTVAIDAGEPTIEANGQPSGTTLELLDAIPYVDAVALATDVAGGTGAEDGTAFLTRAIPLLSRLTSTLVRPVDVEAYVAEAHPEVLRIKAVDLWNPDDPDTPAGSALGYVTVAVAAAGGASIGATSRELIAAELAARMHAGLVVNVVDADVTTVDLDLTVLRYSNADPTATAAAVQAILATYIDPDTWEWANIVRVNEVIATADRAAGVDTVLSVELAAQGDPLAAADLDLPGYAPLVKLGTVNVTVQAPA